MYTCVAEHNGAYFGKRDACIPITTPALAGATPSPLGFLLFSNFLEATHPEISPLLDEGPKCESAACAKSRRTVPRSWRQGNYYEWNWHE
jgi:hypothetical protein